PSLTATAPVSAGTATAIYDRIALTLIAAAAVVALLTFRDYGLGWDDYAHSEYGNLLLAFYRSGFTDTRALSFVNLYMYGVAFDLLPALAAKVLPSPLSEPRRLVGAAVGLVGLLVAWRIGRRVGGPRAGLITLALLATCPLYVGHQFINAKDGPFAVAMAILLLGLVRSFEEYPRPSAATVALTGAGFGLAIGSRVMGGFGVISLVGTLAFVFAVGARREGLRPAAAALARFALALVPAAALALAVIAVIWPWVVTGPLNLFHALDYFSRFFEKPWSELYGGQTVLVAEMPRSYLPTLLALPPSEDYLAHALARAARA